MPELVISRADGTARKVSGYRPKAPASHVPRYEGGRLAELPPRVDLRPYMTAVEDQGETSSCVANATAGAYEYLVKRHQGDDAYDVSRLFIYYNARRLDGSQNEDGGSAIHDAILGLKDFGACSETTWPFDAERVNAKPVAGAYDEAAGFLVEHTQAVPVDLATWKHALAEGHPIIFGMLLFESFDAQRKKGLVPMPSASESSRESHGAHAMLCVGYSDKDQVFIVRNSWGSDWGDLGYCYIPYDYLMNEKYNLGDSWIIKQLESFEIDETTWAKDDESLLPHMDSELANMSDEDHTALLEAVGKVPLETRLALLFLLAGNADGELSDMEDYAVRTALTSIMESVGSRLHPGKVLKYAVKHSGDQALLDETIAIFGEHLSQGLLAELTNEMKTIQKSDGTNADEDAFIAGVVEAWQIGGGDVAS